MTAGSSQHRKPIWDVITRRGLAKKLWFLKRFWQWRCLSNFLLRCQESSPKISPNIRESLRPTVFIWPFVQSQKFMRTNCHAGFCADDDLLNPPSLAYLAWNWLCEEILATAIAEVRHSWKKYCISSSVVPLQIQIFFESMFLHQCSAGFLPSTGMGLYI